MIIKIDIDDGVEEVAALSLANLLITINKDNGFARTRYAKNMICKITKISNAGNIFIHVSKADV